MYAHRNFPSCCCPHTIAFTKIRCRARLNSGFEFQIFGDADYMRTMNFYIINEASQKPTISSMQHFY